MFASPGPPPSPGRRFDKPGVARRAPVRALLIDAMGTLVSLRPPAPALRAQLRARYGIDVSARDAERAMAAEIGFYRTHMALGRDAPSLAALRRGCARAILGSLPVPVAAELSADEVVAVLLAALQFTAFPEAREALGRARAAGCRVVAVSNWDISLPEVLERVGVAPLLDAVVTSAAVGEGKPAPAIFHHALALAGTAPGDALHVGDDLDADVRGAQACGIQAILLRREPAPAATGARVPASADRDVVTIASLAELSWPERGASRRRA